MAADIITHNFTDLPLFGPLTVRTQSRTVRIANRRIVGDVIIEKECSGIVLADCYIVGRVIIEAGAFHCQLDNLWVDDSPEHGIRIGDNAGMAGVNNLVTNVHVRHAAAWGFLIQNQRALAFVASSADINGVGGISAASAHGSFVSPSAESNLTGMKVGMWLYDCEAVVSGANFKDNPTPLLVHGGMVEVKP